MCDTSICLFYLSARVIGDGYMVRVVIVVVVVGRVLSVWDMSGGMDLKLGYFGKSMHSLLKRPLYC